jgi:F-type H+-transporting ATPase subunit alpha
MILYATTHRFLEDVPVDRLLEFERQFIPFAAEQHPKIALNIANEKKLSDETATELELALSQFKEIFMGGNA